MRKVCKARLQRFANVSLKKELKKKLISCHEIQGKECLRWREQSSLSNVKKPKQRSTKLCPLESAMQKLRSAVSIE